MPDPGPHVVVRAPIDLADVTWARRAFAQGDDIHGFPAVPVRAAAGFVTTWPASEPPATDDTGGPTDGADATVVGRALDRNADLLGRSWPLEATVGDIEATGACIVDGPGAVKAWLVVPADRPDGVDDLVAVFRPAAGCEDHVQFTAMTRDLSDSEPVTIVVPPIQQLLLPCIGIPAEADICDLEAATAEDRDGVDDAAAPVSVTRWQSRGSGAELLFSAGPTPTVAVAYSEVPDDLVHAVAYRSDLEDPLAGRYALSLLTDNGTIGLVAAAADAGEGAQEVTEAGGRVALCLFPLDVSWGPGPEPDTCDELFIEAGGSRGLCPIGLLDRPARPAVLAAGVALDVRLYGNELTGQTFWAGELDCDDVTLTFCLPTAVVDELTGGQLLRDGHTLAGTWWLTADVWPLSDEHDHAEVASHRVEYATTPLPDLDGVGDGRDALTQLRELHASGRTLDDLTG